jgi:hypothetical protein
MNKSILLKRFQLPLSKFSSPLLFKKFCSKSQNSFDTQEDVQSNNELLPQNKKDNIFVYHASKFPPIIINENNEILLYFNKLKVNLI